MDRKSVQPDAERRKYVEQLLAQAPPLTAEQRIRLAAVFAKKAA